MNDLSHCPLVLAVELEPGSPAPAPTLSLESAAALVDHVAADLAKLVPGVERMGLALGGALFDPAQVLRPGWPAFAELAQLYAREARGRGFVPQLIGFGHSAGRMATPALDPDAALAGGALLVVPLVLVGPVHVADAVGARLESVLENEGLAGAGTALYLNDSLSMRVAHARYLTHHDLAALTSIQLGHAGLDAAWPLIECALLTPERVEVVRIAPDLSFAYGNGTVHCATEGYAAHAARHADATPDAWCATRLVERRMVALLAAHGLPARVVRLDATPAVDAALADALLAAEPVGSGVVETLDDAPADDVRLVLHVHAELGVAALSAVDGGGRVLAHAYPRDRAGYDALRAQLARRYGCSDAPVRVDGFAVSRDGRHLEP